MDLIKWEPLTWQPLALDRIQSRINELFDETFGSPRTVANSSMGVWYPPVDVLESQDAYLIRAELPGVKQDQIHVEYRQGELTLSGEKHFDEPANGVEYLRAERTTGKFSRSFYLPQGVKDKEIAARFSEGILAITVPKADEAKTKKIEISGH